MDNGKSMQYDSCSNETHELIAKIVAVYYICEMDTYSKFAERFWQNGQNTTCCDKYSSPQMTYNNTKLNSSFLPAKKLTAQP